MSSEKRSPLPVFSTTLLAALRIAVGGSTLVLPLQASALFGVPMAPENKIMARLFGIRDLVLGVLLWTSRGESEILRRAMWAGLVIDAVDVCSCAFGVLDGTVRNRAILSVGAGALSFVGLALLGLRSI